MLIGGGLAFRSGLKPTFIDLTISSNVDNYNVFDEAQALMGPVDPADEVEFGIVRVTIEDGVRVGSTSTAVPAMVSGSGWGAGWKYIDVFVNGTHVARVQGKGGLGGRGQSLEVEPKPNADIGGGGGGGAGSDPGAGAVNGGEAGTTEAGGAGGTPTTDVGGNEAAEDGGDGGDALEATDGGPDFRIRPGAGATLELFGGGAGGGGGLSNQSGGDGGGPGEDGEDGGGLVGSGGTHGLAVSEPGSARVFLIGPGTIDARGA